MKHLGRVLWIVPLAVHVGYLLATREQLPSELGADPGQRGTGVSLFVAEWLVVLGAANLAFVLLHARLPRMSDRMLSVPGKSYWLSTPKRRSIAVEKLRGIVETALLLLDVFFLAVYQLIYQTNVAEPVVSLPQTALIVLFMVLPLVGIALAMLLALRALAAGAREGRNRRD